MTSTVPFAFLKALGTGGCAMATTRAQGRRCVMDGNMSDMEGKNELGGEKWEGNRGLLVSMTAGSRTSVDTAEDKLPSFPAGL